MLAVCLIYCYNHSAKLIDKCKVKVYNKNDGISALYLHTEEI